ncbi:cell division protein FtsK [Shewanella sp. UCD-FRSSP16_17]|uniref:DNA translocase FtsK n=1 Tax=Shewanella sp. UCD-FRSSP16_17 TaxID=1853256 RepID=UPI0007EECA49|nr:DNA translocase FtsK 4TM domain-containing protein [Shewanella sp. UCD-FRSSP16_17]OBT11370.1 cell division protein FtsK [Shewanella sp. UCD-FRSSP16_17]
MSQGNSLQTLSGLQRLLEGGLIICCMTATYILLALSSFDPNDPGWSQSHYQGEISNLTGAVGAWTADVLFYFFGFIAYLIPIIIAATGWFIFNRTHKLFEIDYFSVGLRIIGFMLMVLALAALASMNADDIYVFSAGGVAGDVIGQAMLPYFNNLGTTLLLLCFIGAGFTLATGISWLTVIEGTGYGTIWCVKKIISLPTYFSGNTETEDTRGFLSVVDKFKQGRDNANVTADTNTEFSAPQHDESQGDNQITPATTREYGGKLEPQFTADNEESNHDSVYVDEDNSVDKPSVFSRLKSKLSPRRQQVNDALDDEYMNDSEQAQANINEQGRVEPQLNTNDAIVADDTPAWAATGDAPAVDLTQQNQQNSVAEFGDEFERTTSIGATVMAAAVKNQQSDSVSDSVASTESEPVQASAAEKPYVAEGIIVIPGQEPQVVTSQPRVAMPPLPSISLLDVPDRKENPITKDELDIVARLVETKLADFNIVANVVGVFPGPVVTRFELELAPGVKASKITNLSKDLARSLLAESVRVVEVIPGKAYVGLELPNKFRETVFMRDVLDSKTFDESQSNLSMVLGEDIAGDPVVVDLGKMPHLLVAGTTGSGKSVGVNVMITSILYKSGPDDVRFIMIDPKMLELSVYEGIPHLLCEVVTDMKEAANALRWCVGEMERRYKLMSALGVRNLKGYNTKIKLAKEAGTPIVDPLWKSSESMDEQAPELDKLPSIVVVVDEFADMIMIVGKKVEELIARIAQKARAAGIHLILATQRPSVDVITGLIKANVPTRIAFQVSSRIDSRTILDQQGAETLLGMGDMLYLPPGTSVPIRVHGAFIDDHEVHKVVADWHARGKPQYVDEILNGVSEGEQVLLPGETAETDDDTDQLYDEAVAFVTETRRGSISSVQRKFKIGYNRAARIIEMMEAQGIVSTQGHNGNREVLAPPPPRG